MALDLSASAFIIFVILLVGVIYYKRKKLTIQGIVIMYKTQRGRREIDALAKNHKAFWHHFGTLSIGAAVLSAIFVVYHLLTATIGILKGGAAALALVLPGTAYSQTPGALFLPWYVWVIAIGIMFIPHELSHGVMCRRYGIKVKSVGLLLLAVLPGAFVEPDENQLKRAKLSTRLRIYSIGSFINIVTAGVFYLLTVAFVSMQPTPLSPIAAEFARLLWAIVVITLGVGLVNLLPIYPLDGGKFFHDIAARFMPGAARNITLTLSVFLALIIVFNIASPLLGIFG